MSSSLGASRQHSRTQPFGTGIRHYPADAEEAFQRQDAAFEAIQALARQIALAAGPVAHSGNGNCGDVLTCVKDALAAAGLYVDPASRPRTPPQKKVIKQGLRTKVLERDAYRCVYCGTHKDLSVDHIHPESKGGTLDLGNLQTLCRPCNSTKGNRA